MGTADDPGTFITYYDFPASYAGLDFEETMQVNDPRADHTYKSIEVAASKRLSQGWQFMTSYSATYMNIPFPVGAALNPNAEINVANRNWEWGAKISGSYSLPYGIIASANYDYRSGDPQARQALFTGGRRIRSIVVNVEPIGSIRLPSTHLLDFRATKQFALGGGRTLELRADIFNVMNVNTVINRNLRSGTASFCRRSLRKGQPSCCRGLRSLA